MIANYFHLGKLVVKGEEKESLVQFKPGLNYIFGPTDTGKSFIFTCIDFIFGKKLIKDIPEMRGYDEVFLEIILPKGIYTFSRKLAGGDYNIFNTGYEAIRLGKGDVKTLGQDAGRDFLMELLGCSDKKLKTNERNEVKKLSIRNLIKFFMVDEVRIIDEKSAILVGEVIHNTLYQSLFHFLLTGKDFSHLVKTAPAKIKLLQDEAKYDTVISLHNRLVKKLERLNSDEEGAVEDLKIIEASLKKLKKEYEKIEDDYNRALKDRVKTYQKWGDLKLEANVIKDDMSRFKLLNQHYNSDIERLEFIFETFNLTEQLPSSSCPHCGKSLISPVHKDSCDNSDEKFEMALIQEIQKIKSNRESLKETLEFLDLEGQKNNLEVIKVKEALDDIESILNEEIYPKLSLALVEIKKLSKQRDRAWQRNNLNEEITHLKGIYEFLEPSVQEAKSEGKISFPVESINLLCRKVEIILKKWFVQEYSVSFNHTLFDIMINGKSRLSFGKGSRAIFLTAFYLALYDFTFEKELAHPALFVFDTPLNPFKGAVDMSADGIIEDAVKTRFLNDLNSRSKDLQVIILENKELEPLLKSNLNYIEFTRDLSVGRYGFLEVLEENRL